MGPKYDKLFRLNSDNIKKYKKNRYIIKCNREVPKDISTQVNNLRLGGL